MDTLIRELVHIQEELILEVPDVVFGLYCGPSGTEHLLGHLLALWGNGAIVNEGLESLPVFAFKNFQLLPASLAVISFFSIDVEGQQIVN